MEEMTEYERKMSELILKKEFLLKHINRLLEEYEELEREEETLSDKEFLESGSATFSLDIQISISEEDLHKDLIKRIEGNYFKPGPQNPN